MKKVLLSVGEAVIRFLDNQYVSFDGEETKFVDSVFAIFGHGCVLGAGEALVMGKHSLKLRQGRNEQGMAQVATSYAKQCNRRKIIPCFSSIGPGAANMITAAATATVNNIPLLLFPGDTFATRQPDPVLQQMEQPDDLSITTNDAFRPVVRYFDRICRAEMLAPALINAMRVLTDPAHTGAVCIALPQDVQGESYEFDEDLFAKRVHKIYRNCADSASLSEAAALIKKSRRPLLIVGGGTRYSEAGEAVKALASQCNIPVAETQAGKSAIEGSFALNLGGIGVTGNSAANTIAAKADLILAVGSRLTDFTTASKSLFPEAKLVTINASAFHAEKCDALPLIGDAKATLEALTPLLEGYKTSYRNQISKAKKEWAAEYDRLSAVCYAKKGFTPENTDRVPTTLEDFTKATKGLICQSAAVAMIRKIISPDAIIVGSSGSLPGCLQRMWTTDTLYSYNMEYGYSCMGYEIAGALGSKLACPDKEVYSLVGDGSFLMLHSEMVTAIQERKKINILLFDNCGFGCINNLQMSQGLDSGATEFRYRENDAAIPRGEFIPIDYAKCAEGYGYKTYSVKSPAELEKALKDSLLQEKPVLIDIKVLPKTMTHGYGGWWNVGCTTLPRNDKQRAALREKTEKLDAARKY